MTGEPRRRGPATPRRYERERPGELVHVDVKKVARVPDGGGWRARGADAPDHGRGSGGRLPCLHVAVDDRSRVAYAELLGDEREETCAAFMGRARDFYRGLGVEVERVMTDDGPGYRSRLFNEWLAASGIARRYARPCSPWQNGKAERMNRTLAQEWQYARLRERGGEGRRPLPLHRPLQLGQAPQRLRRPPADVTHRRCKQRHGTQQLENTELLAVIS